MLPTDFIPAKRRRHRKREVIAPASPPVVFHQILWVHYDSDGIYFDAQLSAPVESIVDGPGTIQLSVDGSVWVSVVHAAPDDDDHHHVFLEFGEDLSAATLWRVTTPGNWVFADGELGAPLSGSIG